MDEQEFAQLKAKAISQTNVNNKQHSDAETMGLQIAWLNLTFSLAKPLWQPDRRRGLLLVGPAERRFFNTGLLR
jgi:hypothetical protein